MGYRSDVGIAMYTKDYKTMIRRAEALKNKEIYEFINSADLYGVVTGDDLCEKGFNTNKITILRWDCTKWYSDFKEVKWIENFIKKIDSAIVAIGEDLDDNREMYYGEGWNFMNYIYINRAIELQGVKQKEEL